MTTLERIANPIGFQAMRPQRFPFFRSNCVHVCGAAKGGGRGGGDSEIGDCQVGIVSPI